MQQRLEQDLAKARRLLKEASQMLLNMHTPETVRRFQALDAECLAAERALAAHKGEPYALTLDTPIRWDVGAPRPTLLRSEYAAILIFVMPEDEQTWQAPAKNNKKNAKEKPRESFGVVHFSHCISAKLGSPNEEVLHGHRLYGRGLRGYTAQQVFNSDWIAELRRVNSVHPQFRADRWDHMKHYIFWFHDSTFECIAEDFSFEVRHDNAESLMISLIPDLIE